MEEPEIIGEKSPKKKKKFVYLDKFEIYKDVIDKRIRLMQANINIVYGILGVLVTVLIVLTLIK